MPTGSFSLTQQQITDALSAIRRSDNEQLGERLSKKVKVADGVASDVIAIERSQATALRDR